MEWVKKFFTVYNCQDTPAEFHKKTQRREKGEEKVWPPARKVKFSRDYLGVRVHLDCFRRHV